jgi:hypothetical protein
MASASHELRRSNLRNLVLQHLCRVCLFFVVPGCARASSSSSAPVHSSSPFVKQSLGSGGMVPRIWNNSWRFSGCPSAGPQSKARDTRATYLRLYGGCSGCCCVVSGCVPESSFRVRHVGRKPLLQQITAHVVCLAKVRGRCPLKPPLAEDKVRDVDVNVVFA